MAQNRAVQVRLVAPMVQGAVAVGDDQGQPVEMFENPNLDRYLLRAQEFLGREDYAAAIQVLQDVVEGRTVEVVGTPAPDTPAEGDANPSPDDGSVDTPKPAPRPALDARRAVFSSDGRLFRPVRRLCHELLAQLPDVGIDLYRANYEVAAAELLSAAAADGSVQALEEVANRYFVTLPAGRAMEALADRLMHEGRYRAAVQVLHDLVHVYPPANRRRLGIDDAWCGFKAALCLRLAGETRAARAAAVELADRHPDATLRIEGELQAVVDLPDSAAFAGAVVELAGSAAPDAGPRCVDATTDELVPVWQFRFADPEPYRDPKGGNDRSPQIMWGEGMRATTMPHAGRYGPSTRVTFVPGRGEPTALFLEHFRLRVASAESGLLRAEGDGPTLPPQPRDGHPRVRIAASDFALLRPVVDERRVYVVLGHQRNTTSSVETLKSSELVAYDRDSWQRAWSSAAWGEGEDGLGEVTFLAAPTVFGERLLLPALRRDVYELRCLDRATGRPLWHTPIHAGGSPFFKAPGTPVALGGGTAFVLTNAGCLAAIDAFTGDLRWIRRYERDDPLRARARPKGGGENVMRFGDQYLQADLPGFLPNDLVVRDGLVVLAPIDSDMLLCLDGATGQPVWMLDGTTRYARYGKLREFVGATDDALFFVADRALVCIGRRGGLVRWSRELPSATSRKTAGRGRGTVVGDQVLVPGDREVLVFDAAGERPMRRLALPAFGASREPLDGSFDLVAHGPLLAVGFEGGVEVFGSRPALRAAAAATDDLARRTHLLVEAGDTAAAAGQIETALRGGDVPAGERDELIARLQRLVRSRAIDLAREGRLDAALAALDGIAALLPDRERRLEWYLARLDVCAEADDLRAYEREQQSLYDCMEGRDPGGKR